MEKYTENKPFSRKKEFLFSINDFRSQTSKENIDGEYQHLLNILFMRKGTVPSLPDMGIDLGQYQFESLTEDTLAKISNEITSQYSLYINTETPYIEVFKDDNPTKETAKLVYIFLSQQSPAELNLSKLYVDNNTKPNATTIIIDQEKKMFEVTKFVY